MLHSTMVTNMRCCPIRSELPVNWGRSISRRSWLGFGINLGAYIMMLRDITLQQHVMNPTSGIVGGNETAYAPIWGVTAYPRLVFDTTVYASGALKLAIVSSIGIRLTVVTGKPAGDLQRNEYIPDANPFADMRSTFYWLAPALSLGVAGGF